ncbi:ATP-grasp domain-containing protein [bacterium]|nr:ATP-grasp domain-containing protein [bacterium]
MKDLKKIAIANRGEVAVRVILACQELGIKTVLLHSEADIKTRAYRLSDETVCIGPAELSKSYLSIENNIQGILSSGADAVHPGFGFLSENAAFAQACLDNNITFIGPTPKAIRDMGDKITAKKMVEEENIPTIPGYNGANQDSNFLMRECEKIGYPVIVKATAGGGGRGMKIIRNYKEAEELINSAQREAQSAFGSSQVFLEKYLDHAKHIEVQVFGDLAGQVVHLFDRDCSAQRRHQKIIEESVATTLEPKLREEMLHAAVRLAQKVQYVGAGTVEFLVQDGKYYFMEMNTRLQVEHPVTEMVMGVDLVKAQILTMINRTALWTQDKLKPRGHAIECRICAEDPFTPGVPSTGEILFQKFPDGPGRRFDYGFEAGDAVTPYYDSMIAKVIVWDESRPRAIMKMIETLSQTIIFGVKTNIPFLLQMLHHSDVLDGSLTTSFIQTHFAEGARNVPLTSEEKAVLDKAVQTLAPTSKSGVGLLQKNPWTESWGQQ